MAEQAQSSGLFGIFVIAIFSLLLIPYTVWSLFCSESSQAVKPWQKGKKQSALGSLISKLTTKRNLMLLFLWGVWFILLLWVQSSIKDMKPFDPFEILGLERTASDRDIKKAYRTLSLKYHPDKNPDPEATKYFAEYISKAYAALTDEASRLNYEKYGHPDGPQAMNVGVALPSFMFAKDKKAAPVVLLALVGCGILLPLVAVSWYMFNANKFTGPNNVMHETLAIFLTSKYNVKESQSLVRIPETLVCAAEFIMLPTPAEHTVAIDELRKVVLRHYPDLKDKAPFWKRKASVLKVHMLLLAYMEREDSIPPVLKSDLTFVLQKSPVLLEEMLKIAALPRPPYGYGWMTPAIAIVEMKQSLAQAVSLSERKPLGKQIDPSAFLVQLPHITSDTIKKLKRRKINSIKELQDLSETERHEALESAGLTAAQCEEVTTLLLALPTVHARVTYEVEGEEEVCEQDVAKCKVQLLLTRMSHQQPSFEPPAKGKAVQAYTPLYGQPHEEQWYVMLVDPSNNSLMGYVKVSLAEAEAFGWRRPKLPEEWAAMAASSQDASAGKQDAKPASRAADTATEFIRSYKKKGGSVGSGLDSAGAEGMDVPAEMAGQWVEVQFMAPFKAGKYDLQVIVMCDSYIGCDKVVPARLRVSPLTKAAQESREAHAASKQRIKPDSDEESKADDAGSERGEGESDGEGEEEDGSDYEYDSDETGELETGSDTDDDHVDEAKAPKLNAALQNVVRNAST